jgi:signal transduction histidine kinase
MLNRLSRLTAVEISPMKNCTATQVPLAKLGRRAIDVRFDGVARTGTPVDYASDAPAGAIADERAVTMFRITEEALRNVERHAGATRVTLSLPASLDGLVLTIADDGVGFDADAAHPGHYGLAGPREQARLIGAVLTILSAPQEGTTITVALAPGLDS